MSEYLELPIIWSTGDFEAIAKDIEDREGKVMFDRSMFANALRSMIQDHDANYGITNATIDSYLESYCLIKDVNLKEYLDTLHHLMVFLNKTDGILNTGQILLKTIPEIGYIVKWRDSFGLTKNGVALQKDISLALDLIDEEYAEYTTAVSLGDKKEFIDALIDLTFVCYQLLDCSVTVKNYTSNIGKVRPLLTIGEELSRFKNTPNVENFLSVLLHIVLLMRGPENFKVGIKEVYDSNMSKLVPTFSQAQASIQKYSDEGIATHQMRGEDGAYRIIRDSDGKVLKGILFKEPNFDNLINEVVRI